MRALTRLEHTIIEYINERIAARKWALQILSKGQQLNLRLADDHNVRIFVRITAAYRSMVHHH